MFIQGVSEFRSKSVSNVLTTADIVNNRCRGSIFWSINEPA